MTHITCSYAFTSATRTEESSLSFESIALSKLSKYMASRDVMGSSCSVDEAMELWLLY